MLILLLFAFIAGIVTILSPCILPVLPIVLSGSVSGGKQRPFGIVLGFVASFTLFTLLLTTIVNATGIGSETVRSIAIAVIGLFGISMVIPATQVFLEQLFSRLSPLAAKTNTQRSDLIGGIFIGLSLGLLWTPCVGPILASVITLALTGSTNATAFFITLAYAVGTAIPMFIIMYGGRSLLQRNQWLLRHSGDIQKAFGVVMIGLAVALFFGVDRKFQSVILRAFPAYGTGLTAIENNKFVQDQLKIVGGGSTVLQPGTPANGLLPDLGAAPNPEFTGATKWLNSEPLSLNGNLKGKVVLVDFWTYTCINCIRTLPYITAWNEKYKDKGLVIVGVHSPEFEFEKNEANVRQALKDFKISYPVVQDNDFLIWRAYSNQYWPAHYLIDAKGHIRATHFGEGGYEETERQIQDLLKEAGETVSDDVVKETGSSGLSLLQARLTPETYVGAARGGSYTDTQTPQPRNSVGKTAEFIFQDPLSQDEVGIRGKWTISAESITSASDTSTLSLRFTAGKVFLVLGGKNTDGKSVTVQIDGKPMSEKYYTRDAMKDGISIDMDRKYDIFDSHGGVEGHTVELTIPTGISAYAFTFGQ